MVLNQEYQASKMEPSAVPQKIIEASVLQPLGLERSVHRDVEWLKCVPVASGNENHMDIGVEKEQVWTSAECVGRRLGEL